MTRLRRWRPTWVRRLDRGLGVLRTAAGELLGTDDIAGRVIAAKSFDAGDAILRAAVREQVGSTVKRLHRNGEIENIGVGRANRWRLVAERPIRRP